MELQSKGEDPSSASKVWSCGGQTDSAVLGYALRGLVESIKSGTLLL